MGGETWSQVRPYRKDWSDVTVKGELAPTGLAYPHKPTSVILTKMGKTKKGSGMGLKGG